MRRRRRWIVLLALVAVSNASAASGSAGDLDPSFSSDGIVQRRLGRVPTSIAVLAPHGDILAAANVGCCGGQDVAIARFHSDGALDPSFGDDRMVVIDTGETDRAIWIGRDRADRIAVVGYRQLFGSGCRFEVCINLLLARFLADGSPDPSYGDGGVITIDSPLDRVPLDAAIDEEGRLVLVGRMEQRDETDRTFVARFLDDGSPDPEFGMGGSVAFSEPKRVVAVASTAGVASSSPARSIPTARPRRRRSSLGCCPPATRMRPSAATASSRSTPGRAPPRATRGISRRDDRCDRANPRSGGPCRGGRAADRHREDRLGWAPAPEVLERRRPRPRFTEDVDGDRMDRGRRSRKGSRSPGRRRGSRCGTWSWAGSRQTAPPTPPSGETE